MTDQPSEDRRRRRSEETKQAMTYQLEHVVEEFDMDMMALADERGFVVTSAGATHLAEVFAAHAETLADADDPAEIVGDIMPDLDPGHVFCESISLDDTPLYLCAVMTPDENSRSGFARARTGIQRIYYTTTDSVADEEKS